MFTCTRCRQEGKLGTPEQCTSISEARAHYGVANVRPEAKPFVQPKKLGRRGSVTPVG